MLTLNLKPLYALSSSDYEVMANLAIVTALLLISKQITAATDRAIYN